MNIIYCFKCQQNLKCKNWVTSPAPRNKKVWSAKVPPTNFSAATTPARTTEAVPYIKQTTSIRKIFNEQTGKIQTILLKELFQWHARRLFRSIPMFNHTWISSLNTKWVERYFESNSNALWLAKSSNCMSRKVSSFY